MINNWKIPEDIIKKANISEIEGITLNITEEKAQNNFNFATLTTSKNPFGVQKLKIPVNKKTLAKKELNCVGNYNQIIKDLINENYYTQKRPAFTKLPFDYTKIPVKLRLLLNKLLLKQKKDLGFPEWPVEKSVELIRHFFISSLKNKIGRDIPYLSFWPKGESAFSLSHDCDSITSFKNIEHFREIEEKYGFCSSWNIVPNKYKIDFEKIKKLKQQGCEIGIHGFNHTGKLPYLIQNKINKQLKTGISKLKEYGIKGFRSPLLLRNSQFLDILSNHFNYDSSIPDTDIEHPMNYRNGCCTIFPYFINSMVELPLTLPQDVRLMRFSLTKQKILKIWKEKIEFIKNNKGLAMLNIHPDSFASGNEFGLSCYEALLKHISGIKGKWVALPNEIAEWWKERSPSYISNKNIIGSKRAKIDLF